MGIPEELNKVVGGTSAAERILKEIAKHKKQRKERTKGRVVSTYFSAVESDKLEKRADQGGLALSGLVHEATVRFLDELDENDGTLLPPEPGQPSPVVSPDAVEASAKRLEELAKIVEKDQRGTHPDPHGVFGKPTLKDWHPKVKEPKPEENEQA